MSLCTDRVVTGPLLAIGTLAKMVPNLQKGVKIGTNSEHFPPKNLKAEQNCRKSEQNWMKINFYEFYSSFLEGGTLVKSSFLFVFRFSVQIGTDFQKIPISVQNTDNRNE